MMKRLFFTCGLITVALTTSFAQDTIKVMSYNILNYGNVSSSSCPTYNSGPKTGYLREIVAYENPDILGLVKMEGNGGIVPEDSIMNKVLGAFCPGCYGHSGYSDNSGYSKVSMIYFKVNKFALVSTTPLYTADPNIADIDLIKLYYLNPDLAKNHDTTYLNFILVHLLSGSSSATERGTEMQGVMKTLTTNYPALKNYILMGDFNVKTYTEPCFQAAINPSDSDYKFYDPSNNIGDWDADPTKYAKYLSVDTRTTALSDCGADGGMTDWYDHILVTKDIVNGTDSIQYVPNSLTTVGQDGLHTYNALIDKPANTSAPANIINDLYYMSNHLPEMARFTINKEKALPLTLAIKPIEEQPALMKFTNPIMSNLYFTLVDNKLVGQRINATIYNILGREIYSNDMNLAAENNIAFPPVASGIYIIRLTQNGQVIAQSKIVKE